MHSSSMYVNKEFPCLRLKHSSRRRMMAEVPVDYGYNPVYRCTVSMRLFPAAS